MLIAGEDLLKSLNTYIFASIIRKWHYDFEEIEESDNTIDCDKIHNHCFFRS